MIEVVVGLALNKAKVAPPIKNINRCPAARLPFESQRLLGAKGSKRETPEGGSPYHEGPRHTQHQAISQPKRNRSHVSDSHDVSPLG